MISLLAKRVASVGDAFAETYAGFWLVWEPGQWNASGVFDPTVTPKGVARSGGPADALSFHLKVRQTLKLGRSSTCDIVINDATVSREHLALEPDADGWKVRVLSASGSTDVAGVERKVGDEVPLESGMLLRVGDVLLTFWDTAGLMQRLTAP